METPYKSLTFDYDDTITKSDMDQYQTNLQWLSENTPRGRIDAGVQTDVNVVIVAGRFWVKRNKKENTVINKVSFGNDFSPRCRPNITTGIGADNADKEIFVVVNGPKGQLLPTHNGFEVKVHARNAVKNGKKKKWAIGKGFWVFWHATGWREETLNG